MKYKNKNKDFIRDLGEKRREGRARRRARDREMIDLDELRDLPDPEEFKDHPYRVGED